MPPSAPPDHPVPPASGGWPASEPGGTLGASESPEGLGQREEIEEVEAEELGEDDLVAESELLGAAPPPPDDPLERALGIALAPADDAATLARYGQEIEGETDRGRIALFEHEAGQLLEQSGDEANAVKAYARTLSADANLRPNLWAVRRVFTRRRLWDKLLRLLDAEVRSARDDVERGHALLEKGAVYEDKIGDLAIAKELYEKARVLFSDLTATAPLWRLALARGDAKAERDLLGELAARTRNPARRVALLLEQARAHEAAGEPETSHAILRGALDLGVERTRVLDALEALCGRTGKASDLLDVLALRSKDLEQALADGPSEELIRRLIAAGRREAQAARALGDLDRAIERTRSLLERAPNDLLLREDLLELYAEAGRDAELEPFVAGLLEALPPERRPPLLELRVEALARQGRLAEAGELLARMLDEQPGLLPLHFLRERLALANQLPADLALLYGAQGEALLAAGEARFAASSFTKAAAVASRSADRLEEARALTAKALEVLPGFPSAEQLEEDLLARLGRHDERAAILRVRAERQEGEPRAATLERLLAVQLDDLTELDGALSTIDQLTALRPHDRALAFSRIEILDRLGHDAALAEALVTLAAQTEDGETAADLRALAALLLEELASSTEPGRDGGERERARSLAREVLALFPRHPLARALLRASAMRAGDLPLLATLLEEEALAQSSASAIGARLAAASTLALVTGDAARAGRLAGAFHERVEGAASARWLAHVSRGDRAAEAAALAAVAETSTGGDRLLARLDEGDAYERTGRLDAAVVAWNEVATGATAEDALVPAVLAANLAIGEAIETAGNSEDLPPILDRLASVASDPTTVAALSLAAAAAATSGDTALVRARCETLSGGAAALPAALFAIADAALEGDVHAYGAALGALEPMVSSRTDRAAITRRLATLELRRGDIVAASRAIGLALELAGSPTPSLALIAYDLDLSPSQRAAVCDARAERHEGATRVALLGEAADSYAREGRLADAARRYEAALEQQADSITALDGLRRVARAGGDEEGELAATLRLGERLVEPDLRGALYVRAGALLERLGRRRDAAAVYRRALEARPGDEATGDRLCELLRLEGEQGALREALDFRIASFFVGDAAFQETASRAPLWAERASLRRAAEDRTGAIADYRHAVALARTDVSSLTALAELVEKENPSEAAALYTRAAEATPDRSSAGALRLRLARLQAESLEQRDLALEEATIAAELLEDRPDALELVASLALAGGDRARAAQALRRLARRSDGAKRAQAALRAAVLHEEIGEGTEERSALEEAVAADPDGAEAPLALARVLRAGDPTAASRILSEAIDRQRDLLARGVEPGLLAAIGQLAMALESSELARHARLALDALEGRPLEARAEAADEAKHAPPPATFATLRPPPLEGVAGDLLSLLAEAVMEADEIDPLRRGLQKSDRLASKALASRAPLVARALAFFSCDELDVWIAIGRPDCCELLPGRPARLIVGVDVASGSATGARQWIGQAAYAARAGLVAVAGERATPAAIASLVGAGLTLAGVALPAVLAGTETERRSAQIGKTLPRKDRKTLQTIAPALARASWDPAAIGQAVRLASARAGLLFSGDLAAALIALVPSLANGGKDGARDALISPLAADLIRFALSATYATLRGEATR